MFAWPAGNEFEALQLAQPKETAICFARLVFPFSSSLAMAQYY